MAQPGAGESARPIYPPAARRHREAKSNADQRVRFFFGVPLGRVNGTGSGTPLNRDFGTAIMEKGGRALGEDNDIRGLLMLWNFGWLRPQELGLLLWPSSPHRVKYAERIGRKWLAQAFIIARQLPNHHGTAWVLSKAGAALLNEKTGVPSRSGKDWGNSSNGSWSAPQWWRHDLLAHSLLALLASIGHEVIPERQLRRENSVSKLPDGLSISPDGTAIYWIEIESARKSGKHMDLMAEALVRIAIGKAPTLSGHKAKHSMICYASSAIDERGYRLNHRERVLNALSRHAPRDLLVALYQLTLKGPAVAGFRGESVSVQSDLVSKRLQQWRHYWFEDPDDEGVMICHRDGREFSYWQEADDCWGWQATDMQITGNDGYPVVLANASARTKEGAERALAGLAIWD